MFDTFTRHWPEYLMEAAELGIFMMSACLFTALLGHPASLLQQAINSPLLQRMFIGVAMGLTVVGIIFSPWGKQSGAHINPSVTSTFFRLVKIAFGARVRVTAVRPPVMPPHVEFLEYETPPGGRPMPLDTRANDIWHWQTQLVVDDVGAVAPGFARRCPVHFSACHRFAGR